MSDKTLVLNSQEVLNRVDRMAWQLYEMNLEEQEVLVVGIAKRGYLLAEGIARRMREISPLQVTLGELTLDKDHLLETSVTCSLDQAQCSNRVVILVDDVMNSGGTLMFAARYFLDFPLKRLVTVVLVDRSHKRYPIHADVTGISLATTMKERVEVAIEEAPYGVYLV